MELDTLDLFEGVGLSMDALEIIQDSTPFPESDTKGVTPDANNNNNTASFMTSADTMSPATDNISSVDLLSTTDTIAMGNNASTTDTTSKSDAEPDENDNMDVSTIKAKFKVEYNLRRSSLVNRVETEKRRKSPKEPKPKSRPPPLSKYRRRAANARERGRMLEINDAFNALANAIPDYEEPEQKGKATKITTLRLALNYIAALRETLGYPSGTSESGFSSSGEGCNSPSGSSVSDTASEGLQSPARSNLDSEGETIVH